MSGTLEILRRVMSSELGLSAEGATLDSSLEDLGIDSLGFLELMFALDKELNINFPESPEGIRTVGDVVAIIDRLLSQNQSQERKLP